ncbi:predicted protein [Naegleria gruberi]|uniref:Predicted protein n=1 Tax=Naegleria gruberi TaxID=5762 RepID=D2V9Q4_NAEGR|nr:uncharacterized protein NAEGRDRAFT_79092 [Naegleria gruberi]EFC46505.1 predicted protein [Naegleria gruberi]|eukprot:XP_002679249.1 predicted protein [Naegleria gruberi strain NEG-M]
MSTTTTINNMEVSKTARTVMIVCMLLMGMTLIHGATTAIQLKSSGDTVTGSVSKGIMNMYYINVDSVSSMSVQFTNTYSSSSVNVYIKANQPPTTYNYDSIITYPGVSKSIITLKNSTLTQPYYIGVYGLGSSTNYYTLQVSVISGQDIANWVIGVIVAAVIITILCAVAAVLIPILICCGVLSCTVCCGAAAGAAAGSAGSSGTYQQIHHNHTNHVHHSISQPIAQQPTTYYSGQQPPQQQQYYPQPTSANYQKV